MNAEPEVYKAKCQAKGALANSISGIADAVFRHEANVLNTTVRAAEKESESAMRYLQAYAEVMRGKLSSLSQVTSALIGSTTLHGSYSLGNSVNFSVGESESVSHNFEGA
jgi:predicted anti-sigma-YlaC factor YlaD